MNHNTKMEELDVPLKFYPENEPFLNFLNKI